MPRDGFLETYGQAKTAPIYHPSRPMCEQRMVKITNLQQSVQPTSPKYHVNRHPDHCFSQAEQARAKGEYTNTVISVSQL